MKEVPKFYSIDDVERYYKNTSQGHWFDKDATRFFKSRMTSIFKKIDDFNYIFVSSEKSPDADRMYTVRHLTISPDDSMHCGYDLNISNVSDFCSLTRYKAQAMVKSIDSIETIKEITRR